MNNIFLDDEQNGVPEDKGSIAKYQVKIKHLNDLNKKISIENDQLKAKIKFLEQERRQFLQNNVNQSELLQSLNKQLQNYKQKNSQLSKKNEQLLATILVNQQMNAEAKKEMNFYVSRYQQKILQLRQSLQLKQLHVQTLQEKYQKNKSLNLPMSVKNANRYTSELLKYEQLIQQMIQQRNKDALKAIQQINNITKSNNQQQKNKIKSCKNIKNNFNTDVRVNLNTLNTEMGQSCLLNRQNVDLYFLRLHLEIRQLKKKYRQRLEDILQLKNKDKIMKQGYNTLTKQIQKVKVENCQLKIKIDHLSKKLQTAKDISIKVRSVDNIPKKSKQKENAQSKFSSQVSIQANLSDARHCLKANLPSQTKYDTLQVTKSHNFDQRIQNIEGILSLDSSPQFKHRRDKKQLSVNQQNDDEQLSICQQNSVDMSISLDASGFLAPQKSHHEISQNILRGLIDKKIF